ncbi:unnamed protein product, partial [Musa hybrid cultivar]
LLPSVSEFLSPSLINWPTSATTKGYLRTQITVSIFGFFMLKRASDSKNCCNYRTTSGEKPFSTYRFKTGPINTVWMDICWLTAFVTERQIWAHRNTWKATSILVLDTRDDPNEVKIVIALTYSLFDNAGSGFQAFVNNFPGETAPDELPGFLSITLAWTPFIINPSQPTLSWLLALQRDQEPCAGTHDHVIPLI